MQIRLVLGRLSPPLGLRFKATVPSRAEINKNWEAAK